jgi:hypothetical protein
LPGTQELMLQKALLHRVDVLQLHFFISSCNATHPSMHFQVVLACLLVSSVQIPKSHQLQ